MKQPRGKTFPILLMALIASLIANVVLLAKNFLPLSVNPLVTGRQTVVKIIDGDTFDTQEGQRIRLALIDAPEYPQDCLSLESKQRLSVLILGKEVSIDELGKDNFGRTLAFIFRGTLFVNKSQLEEGLAEISASSQTKYTHDLEIARDAAVSAKRGIWSDKCQNSQKKGCLIKGNYRKETKTKIYHLPDCYNYDKISVNLNEKDAWFCSEKEAQNAGFTKSLDCP